MNLENQLLLHIAKGLIAHCRLYIQHSKTVNALASILKRLETAMDYGFSSDEEFTQLVEQTQEIKLELVDHQEPLYLAANSIGHLAYSLLKNSPKTTKSSLTIVMAEISVVLDLNV